MRGTRGSALVLSLCLLALLGTPVYGKGGKGGKGGGKGANTARRGGGAAQGLACAAPRAEGVLTRAWRFRVCAGGGGGGGGDGDEEIIIPLGTEEVIPMGFGPVQQGGGGSGGFSIPLNMDPSMFQGPQVYVPFAVLPPHCRAGAPPQLRLAACAGRRVRRANPPGAARDPASGHVLTRRCPRCAGGNGV